MKKIGTGIACLLILMLCAGNAAAQKNVLVVCPINKEAAERIDTYIKFFAAVEEILKPQQINTEYLYVELDNAPDDAARSVRAKEAIEQIKKKKPDVIVATSDLSVKYIATQIDTIPCVFGYVYGDIKALGLPKPNVTGVNRRSYAPDIWGLANKLMGVKTVAMLTKESPPMHGIRQMLLAKAEGLEKLCGVKFLEMYMVNTLAEWEAKAKDFPADMIYIGEPSRLLKADGSQTGRKEVVEWTVANSKKPVIAATGEDVEYGALFTILSSEKTWGNQTAELVSKILNGKTVAELPIEDVKKGALWINTKTALQYKIEIPYAILSTAEKIFE